MLGWQAHGIEPGGYGHIGSQALGVKIDRLLLGQGSEADGNKYDCIYASEVLEHLADPDSFLRTCHDHLNHDGVLIMTTPAAEYINKVNPPEEVYACLFPGEHKIIFSAKGLESALSRAGFRYFKFEKRRDSNWLILASPQHDVQSIYGKAELDQRANQQYNEYLHRFLDSHSGANTPQQQRVTLALCFRLIKFLVNKGHLHEALKILRQWYSDIAILADPELKHILTHEPAPADNETLICCLLNLCLIGMARERIEVELYQQSYPRSGAAFFKTLGFFITMIAHNIEIDNKAKTLRSIVGFLEPLIDYAIYAKGCKTPFYHLELVSLIGPATSALFLAKKKLGMSISRDDYAFISQNWFTSSYPNSHNEIEAMCSNRMGANDHLVKQVIGNVKASLKPLLGAS